MLALDPLKWENLHILDKVTLDVFYLVGPTQFALHPLPMLTLPRSAGKWHPKVVASQTSHSTNCYCPHEGIIIVAPTHAPTTKSREALSLPLGGCPPSSPSYEYQSIVCLNFQDECAPKPTPKVVGWCSLLVYLWLLQPAPCIFEPAMLVLKKILSCPGPS